MHRMRLFILIPLLVLTACGRGEPAQEPTAGETASQTASPAPSETVSEQAATQETTAWFLRETPDALWVEPRTTLVPPTEGVARAAMEFLFSGKAGHPDLIAVVSDVEVRDVRREDDVLVVDVAEDVKEARGSAYEDGFAQQFAYTAAQFDGVRGARLLVEGEEIDSLWGHMDWSGVMEPEPFKETPITIESPDWGERVGQGTLTASGQANTFEATLAVRLVDPDGKTVEEEWITATSGSGTRGTWAHTFDAPLDRAGTWTVEAEEPDPSGGAEGRKPLVVRQQFQVP